MNLKTTLVAILTISVAETLGFPVGDLAGGAAVPMFALLVISSMLGASEELSKGLGRVVVGLVVVGLTAHLGKALVLALISSPVFWGLGCVVLATGGGMGALHLLAKAAMVNVPEKRRIARVPVRDRLRIVHPIADRPWPAAPPPETDDEVGVFRGRE